MWQYGLRILVTAMVVVGVAEIGKRSSLWGAVLASLPLTSLLAFIWLYVDTSNTQSIAALSTSIFWLVLPSLVLFIALPVLLRSNVPFWPSLAVSCAATVAAYFGTVWVLGRFHVHL